jgi:predicted nucleic acid-binding protein
MGEKVQSALNLLVDSSEVYPLIEEDEVVEFKTKHGKIITDKGDLVILATAFKAKVDGIITGDKHFDNLEVKKLIEVISASQALKMINS